VTGEEDSLQAFEAAMRWHGFNPPERATSAHAFAPYNSVRDSDRYRGWCMAREAAAAEAQRLRSVETAMDSTCSTPTPPPP